MFLLIGNELQLTSVMNLNSSVDHDENREYREKQELIRHYAFTRWTKKNETTYYGYKNHVKTDARYKVGHTCPTRRR
jgi:hypothetical protein